MYFGSHAIGIFAKRAFRHLTKAFGQEWVILAKSARTPCVFRQKQGIIAESEHFAKNTLIITARLRLLAESDRAQILLPPEQFFHVEIIRL